LEPANELGADPGPAFDPGQEAPAPVDAAALDQDEYAPPPPQLVEWTPERAESVVRGIGFLLHRADALGSKPGGDELWRATEQDAADAAPPLARILNRYEPARRLAGISDEAELGFVLAGYVKRNLAMRGRLSAEQRDLAPDAVYDGAESAPAPKRSRWPFTRRDRVEPEPEPAAPPLYAEEPGDADAEVIAGPWRGEGFLPPPPTNPPVAG
jgi:hypothetical protein